MYCDPSRSPGRHGRGAGPTPAAVAALLLIVWAVDLGCSGRQPVETGLDEDLYVTQSDRAYLRLPNRLLDAEVEAEMSGPELIHCYELEAASGPWDITSVQLQLFVQGGRLRARIAQDRSNLSESFASCIERVTLDWDLHPGPVREGEIVPLEFGPLPESETP